jgi:hypothetical protein
MTAIHAVLAERAPRPQRPYALTYLKSPLTRRFAATSPLRGEVKTVGCLIYQRSISIRLNRGTTRGDLHLSPTGRGRREAAGEGLFKFVKLAHMTPNPSPPH